MWKSIIAISLALPLIVIMSISLPSVDATIEWGPNFEIVPYNPDMEIVLDCTVVVYDVNNPLQYVTAYAGQDGVISVDLSNTPWYYNGIECDVEVSDTPGEHYFPTWREKIYDDWDAQSWECYSSLYVTDENSNTYHTGKHYWSGMDRQYGAGGYIDESVLNDNPIPISPEFPNMGGDPILWGSVYFTSAFNGHFSKNDMICGYAYQWKLKFKISIIDDEDEEIDSADSGWIYKSASYYDEENPPDDVHVDPPLEMEITKFECIPTETYYFVMEITHLVKIKLEEEDWEEVSYSDFSEETLPKEMVFRLEM